MLTPGQIQEIAEEQLKGTDLFVVGVKISPASEIELLIDSDTSVSIDKCVTVSRAVEAAIEEVTDDFALMVASAGIGQPLKVFRQYKKLIGKPVEVLLKSGVKVVAELRDAAPDEITLVYTEKVVVEGRKRKELQEIVKTYPLEEVKMTVEYLDYK